MHRVNSNKSTAIFPSHSGQTDKNQIVSNKPKRCKIRFLFELFLFFCNNSTGITTILQKIYIMKSIQEDFLKIVSNYQGIIHKVNLIYFRVIVDREDNFQEILLQLWKSFPQLKDRTKIGSWIYAVAINTSISKIRKDSKLVFQELTDSTPEMSLEDNADSFEVDVNFQKLIEALHQLNQIDRSIMLLYLEELDYNEIAEIMGITSTNVGVRINRSKKQLKKYLNK